MEIAESILLTLSLILMIAAMFASIIPFLPGPILVWGIALVTAFFINFERVTPLASVLMTLLMLAGATTPYWLPFFGVRDEGLTCLGAVGSIVGGLLGTFLIPIPILGTIIGSIVGALLIEFARIREMRRALRAGQLVFKMYLIGILVDIAFSLVIIIVFVVSTWSTG